MQIGILGAGAVAKTIGRGLIDAGHTVAISSRSPEREDLIEWKRDTQARGEVVTFAESVRFGEVLIVAIHPWTAIEAVLRLADTSALEHKLVIDVGNAIDWTTPPPKLALQQTSLGELVQSWLPDSHVVKALNINHVSRVVHPHFKNGTPAAFVSGNDTSAKAQARELLVDLGWQDVIDLGGIERSRLQEALMLTTLLCEVRMQTQGAAFSLLRS